MTAPDWRQRGACVNEDPDLFFRESRRGVKQAKAVCEACPVRACCLMWVLDQLDDRFGVVAGMTPSERARLRAAMGKVAV